MKVSAFPNDTTPKIDGERSMVLEVVGNRARTAPKSAAATWISVETRVEPGGVASTQNGESPDTAAMLVVTDAAGASALLKAWM